MANYYVPTKGAKSWKEFLADPGNQWKKGYSAYELAHCWEGGSSLPMCVNQVFRQSQIPLFQEVSILFGFPEYKVPLPGGSSSSQNDLYVLAKVNGELLTIMVEGKVSEPFGETVEAWLGKDPSEGKRERLDNLIDRLHLNPQSILNKRYQLLHRTASALIEANQVNAKNALMLVHSFSETGKWYEDYADFVELFNLSPKKDTIVGPVLLDGINLFFGWVTGETSKENEENYKLVKTMYSQTQKVELWSTARLPFEPKNWMKEMRDELKDSLKLLTPVKNGTLYGKFCTSENDSFFDVENVLLYNVGTGSFSHLGNEHVIIERSFQEIPTLNHSTPFQHYHLYNHTVAEKLDLYWKKEQTAVEWTGLQLPALKDKPHVYWHKLKQLNSTTNLLPFSNNTTFGLRINLGVPIGKKVNLVGICKPLIDGIISAFHSYAGNDLDEMVSRLSKLLNEDKSLISNLLVEEKAAHLGKREVVRRFQKGVQWNPADDYCYQIELKTFKADGANWEIGGELYTISKNDYSR
ncbi:DUF6946 family protein [Neobacillus drentensis]|uniref:DUF6946 family protein n=1 Tax=Neobacillus drentensis TaxID=220684 RepID=UPI0030007805